VNLQNARCNNKVIPQHILYLSKFFCQFVMCKVSWIDTLYAWALFGTGGEIHSLILWTVRAVLYCFNFLYQQGLIYHYLGSHRLAEKMLRDAARIDPNSHQTW